ncbi:MAG TPA: GspE/PulE family protein [Candidatus Binatia bacterium]|nr:GspE/PulE family protein [Candidatus Binatia bacterium]
MSSSTSARSRDRVQDARAQRYDESGAPAVRLLDAYLAAAAAAAASDLHFEPDRSGLRIRMRVDGHLRDLDPPPAALIPALLARIRLLARVDLAERRVPQDGRFGVLAGGERVDVRAAFLPVARGEKIALRLLPHGGAARTLEELGMQPAQRACLERALARSNGLIIVAGPTGSGKSTTLYAALSHLRRPSRSIVSVEDPVELDVEGVSQVPVDEEVGRSFAIVLRALLRQDPDVVMIGEIRDGDSARIACRAALTGHLVLSSVHASHAREALLRMPEMGVADYLVRATISLVIAQRLVRRLCPHCRASTPLDPAHASLFATAGMTVPATLASPAGCECCDGVGYRGRIPLFEIAAGSEDAPAPFAAGSLGACGLSRVLAGETSLEETLAHCPQPAERGALPCS